MLRVLLHIQEHLDESLRLEELAAVAHFSPYHFHRVFRGMTGESVQRHVRRLRLERAAQRLKSTDKPVTAIAFEAGYETHEAFTRAFGTMFGESPSSFRGKRQAIKFKAALSGVHFASDAAPLSFEPVRYGGRPLEVTVERLEPMNVAFIRHVGAYDQVGTVWNRLFAWAVPRGLVGPTSVAVGVTYDDPDVTPAEYLRCDACLVLLRMVEPDGEVAVQQIGGGDYGRTRHIGPYKRFPETYARLFGEWLPQSGREARSAPALEFYRNAPFNTAPEDLITDIFIPLEDES
jgi:AraC family transcriptional regulator